jgi:hypothetical protein
VLVEQLCQATDPFVAAEALLVEIEEKSREMPMQPTLKAARYVVFELLSSKNVVAKQ